MTRRERALAIVLLAVAVAGCSGSGSTPHCSLHDPAVAARSSWPKFRHDVQNTGAIALELTANNGQQKWVFPDQGAKRAFTASPVLNDDESLLYIGSTDGTLYAINTAYPPVTPPQPTPPPTPAKAGSQNTNFDFAILDPIGSTAATGLRDGMDAVFIGAGDGHLYAVGANGMPQSGSWPFLLSGFISASPTLLIDGTVYVGGENGIVSGVCPNGIARAELSVDSTASSPAVSFDNTIIYFGADDRQLRAISTLGALQWTFPASAPITTAPVVEASNGATTAIYVADLGGLVFKVGTNGRQPTPAPTSGIRFDFLSANPGVAPVGPIRSSPALANGRLYFGSDDGKLYAVDTASGKIDWSFATGAAVTSSPAVATGGGHPIVVFGSDDGNVYFVEDDGTTAMSLHVFPIGQPVRSSPAIDKNGVVYIGADDGRVYAIE